MVINSTRLPDGGSQGVDQRAIWRAQLVAEMQLGLQMGPIFNFTSDFNRITVRRSGFLRQRAGEIKGGSGGSSLAVADA